ncbi:MAG: hypothetical protein HOP19_14420 [Acidobacteria bacterium]|nr:hypothetical protein [Acidobacteriota bacterium]
MKNNELYLKSGMNGLHEPAVWEGAPTTPHHATHATTPFRPAATGDVMSATVNGNVAWRGSKTLRHNNESTPLAKLVRQRLGEMGIKQSEFCRAHRFDQGLLSKIQNSVITNLSLESVLRLSVGLSVPPEEILALLDRMDLHDLVLQAYSAEFTAKKAEK